MEVVLDEISLVRCSSISPAERIQTMAAAIRTLDLLGCARVLRSTSSAADMDIGQGRGLRGWCFDPQTNRDAGRLIALRLGKQPFIDGTDGLFHSLEGNRAIEGRMENQVAMGLTFAALIDVPLISLYGNSISHGTEVAVEITMMDDDGEFSEIISVYRLVTAHDVQSRSKYIRVALEAALSDGNRLLELAGDLFPRLLFGPTAWDQIARLTGNEPCFHHLIRHLRALDRGALSWTPDTEFHPSEAISWSRESRLTLNHRTHGPLRDFPMPEGFSPIRWSLHSKMGGGIRLYFQPVRPSSKSFVLIGYFGDHLPTVRF